MAQLGETKSVAVAFIGKVKTAAQMTAIIALLLWEPVIPGVSTPLARHDRAVGRGDPHAVVDVPLPASSRRRISGATPAADGTGLLGSEGRSARG